MDTEGGRQYLTTQQAAHELGVTDSRIRQFIRNGQLRSIKFGRHAHMIDPRDLEPLRARKTMRGPAKGLPRHKRQAQEGQQEAGEAE